METVTPMDMRDYWTVIVPYPPAGYELTEWHPDGPGTKYGPLTRGVFRGETAVDEAIAWGEKHLRGAPFHLMFVETGMR